MGEPGRPVDISPFTESKDVVRLDSVRFRDIGSPLPESGPQSEWIAA